MSIPELLLNTLEDLGTDDFKKFQWYLSQPVLKDLQGLPRSHLEDQRRHATVDRMVESYGQRPAVTLTMEILRRISHNETARKLEDTLRHGSVRDRTDGLGPGEQVECAPAPPPSVSVSAEHSVVVLPALYNNNCPAGSINFNINIKQ